MADESDASLKSAGSSRHRTLLKLAVFAALVLLVVALVVGFRGRVDLAALAARENELLDYGRAHPALLISISFAIYVTVTGLSLPAATVLTIANAWLLRQLFGPIDGFVAAVLLVSFASTLGATIAFLLSRYLLRDAIQSRFGQHLTRFNAAIERDGAFYLFTLRLIAHIPFFVVNAVMGLTRLPTRTFWWVSQLGMLPGTLVFVYTGWAVPSLTELVPQLEARGARAILSPPLVIAFVLLGLFPLVVKKIVSRVERGRSAKHGT